MTELETTSKWAAPFKAPDPNIIADYTSKEDYVPMNTDNKIVYQANRANTVNDNPALELPQPRKACLSRAEALITKDRAEDYGSPQESFLNIARIWSVILGIEVLPHQVALCMAGLKISRLTHDSTSTDGYDDLAGYAALAYELSVTQLTRS